MGLRKIIFSAGVALLSLPGIAHSQSLLRGSYNVNVTPYDFKNDGTIDTVYIDGTREDSEFHATDSNVDGRIDYLEVYFDKGDVYCRIRAEDTNFDGEWDNISTRCTPSGISH